MSSTRNQLLQSLINLAKKSNLAKRLAKRWVVNRNVTIYRGVGAGLRFNPGQSNPNYAFGTNELPVQEAIAEHLEPGSVFFDIGANVGFFTVIAARLAGKNGHVYAFEPVPENAKFVRSNIALNGFSNITLFELAVSRSSGQGELLLSSYSGGATLSKDDKPPDFAGTTTVELASIDDLISANKVLPPGLIKIDVEGAEMEVLLGMRDTINTYRPIIIYEVDAANKTAHDQKKRECDAYLQEFDYSLRVLEDSYPGAGWIVSNTIAFPK